MNQHDPPQHDPYRNSPQRVPPGSDATGQSIRRGQSCPAARYDGDGRAHTPWSLPPSRICEYTDTSLPTRGLGQGKARAACAYCGREGIFPLYLTAPDFGTLATLRSPSTRYIGLRKGLGRRVRRGEKEEGRGISCRTLVSPAWGGRRQYELSLHFGLRQVTVAC